MQEVKGREKGVEIISNGYRLLWSGASKPENEAGPIVANWLVENIVEVESPSDRIMKVKVAIGDEVWEVFSCYSHRSSVKKDEFYELLDQVVFHRFLLVVTLMVMLEVRLAVLVKFMVVMGLVSEIMGVLG